MILGKEDEDFVHSLFHKYDPARYDPVKAHAYYERTKKLKGRKKGSGSKTRPKLLGRGNLPPANERQGQTVTPGPQADVRARASAYQARLDKLNEAVRQRKELALQKAEEQKQKAALQKQKDEEKARVREAKQFELDTKQLELDSRKLDLDDQQSELSLKQSELEKLKTDKKVDPVSLARAERQIKLEASKLEIAKKRFDLEKKKLDSERQKLSSGAQTSTSPTSQTKPVVPGTKLVSR